MPRIDDLRAELQNLTHEELREKLRALRSDRRITKTSPKAIKAKVKEGVKTKTAAQKVAASMTPEELAALIQEIEGS